MSDERQRQTHRIRHCSPPPGRSSACRSRVCRTCSSPTRITRVPLAGAEIAGRAQSARPHRHRDRYAQAARAGPRATKAIRRWRSASNPTANHSAFWSTRSARCSKLPDGEREPNPINLDRKLARVVGRHFPARRPAHGRSRCRPRSRPVRRGGRGVIASRRSENAKRARPAQRGVRRL